MFPTNIEKQKVNLALYVFSEKTSAALQASSISKNSSSMASTAKFIDNVCKLWKLLNCKSFREAKRNNDPDRRVLDGTEDGAIGFALLKDWAQRAVEMRQVGNVRQQSLTRDTANAVRWTCLCLADFCKFLLETDSSVKHKYIPLGFFQQDDLEHHFGHFRMSAGCNFYITVKEVFATHNIDRAKLMLNTFEEYDNVKENHQCDLCEEVLSDREILLLDDLVESVEKIHPDEKLSLFYIAGYVASKHEEVCGSDEEGTFEEVKEFLDILDRGKLSYPTVPFFDFVLLAYVFFSKTPDRLCRTRFVNIIRKFPENFHVDIFFITDEPLQRLSNVFFNSLHP